MEELLGLPDHRDDCPEHGGRVLGDVPVVGGVQEGVAGFRLGGTDFLYHRGIAADLGGR